jgi:hypothetical protein
VIGKPSAGDLQKIAFGNGADVPNMPD